MLQNEFMWQVFIFFYGCLASNVSMHVISMQYFTFTSTTSDFLDHIDNDKLALLMLQQSIFQVIEEQKILMKKLIQVHSAIRKELFSPE